MDQQKEIEELKQKILDMEKYFKKSLSNIQEYLKISDGENYNAHMNKLYNKIIYNDSIKDKPIQILHKDRNRRINRKKISSNNI